MRVQTWLTDVRIIHPKDRKRVAFTGVLNGQTPTTGPLKGQTIKIYYRLRGSKTWHLIGTTTSQTNGTFTYRLTNRPHGYYRATFTPTTYYLNSTSPGVNYTN